MLKVDLQKAFDMVDWSFLGSALVGFGFPPQYCAWIQECITTVSYSISLNGGIYGFFSGRRGLRQGDPLSPLLFGLCIEVLSRRLQRASSEASFHFHPMCKKIGLTHLAYADDLMMFARADESSVRVLADCLARFGNTAGLRANPLKSHMYMAGIDVRTKERLLQTIGFQEGTFPFRYLGIPLAAEKLRIATYGPLLEAITRRVNAWPKRSLSYAGRLELVRTVLQGLECYWLSLLPIPGGVIEKIKSICRTFVWESKHPPASWTTMCLAKTDGGYGIRDLHAWNEALLSKTLWDIQSNVDSLWVRWVRQHYLKNADFWHWTVKPVDSPLIKRLVDIRDKICRTTGSIGAANMKLIEWFASEKKGAALAYNFFRPGASAVPWVSVVWRPEIMPKHRFFLWLLAHERLQTSDRLPYEPNKECALCRSTAESQGHVFFECPIACALWGKVKPWLGIDFAYGSIQEFFRSLGQRLIGTGRQVKAQYLGISSTIYLLWDARNRCRFEGTQPDVDRIFHRIQLHVYRFKDL